jgi:hypothetical protein
LTEANKARASLCVPPFIRTLLSSATPGTKLAIGIQFLFDWIDKNGPAPKIEPRVVSVDILESIAVVRLEVAGWSGNLTGSGVRMSDLFTLLKMPSGWKIIQKAFHWHA